MTATGVLTRSQEDMDKESKRLAAGWRYSAGCWETQTDGRTKTLEKQ